MKAKQLEAHICSQLYVINESYFFMFVCINKYNNAIFKECPSNFLAFQLIVHY